MASGEQAAVRVKEAVQGAREMGIERPSRRSRKTRRALVEAARALLEEEGVGALTVKAVTDRADVGHGTFYHHFPSTEAVLAAGIVESMREFAQEMERGFAKAPDKGWVFVASLSNTFRMLAGHPALPWMLERPHLLADALREACGPFARQDLEAMAASGELSEDVVAGAGRYMVWLIVGALIDASAQPLSMREIEAKLVELVMRTLGLQLPRIRELVGRLGELGTRKVARSRPAK